MFKFRYQLVPTLFLVCTSFILSAQKKYNSLFWEISGNGLSKPSYLYGTMHVSNKVAFHLSDSFFIAIKNVDVVALESNPENWMKELYDEPQNEMSISKNLPQNASSFYKNGFYLNIPENKDLKGVLKYYPQIVNNLLYRKREGQDNFEENTYLDLFIMQSGRKYGKEIASLENYKHSQMLVDKASESIDENEEDQISWSKKSKILKGMTYSDIVEDAYRKGDLDFMDSIAKVFYPSKNYNKYMLEIRNEIMVKGMDSIMKQKRLFTGVGAAHLPGDKGVINMLIKLGYKVRPIFLNSELESKYKEEVEKINFPVAVSTYSDPDSLFSVEVPGKMHEIARTKSYKYYFYPDMVNGCFYMIMTVQNYSALLGQKPSDYAKKLDSLLFENIPGKINKKTSFTTSNGLTGYLIENTTKRGDQQYYKIIFSPTQLIIAKVNGNAEYAKGAEAQRFLNSLKINDQRSKTFVQHNFNTIGASVYMPKHLQMQTAKDLGYRTFANYIALGLDENNKQYAFLRSVYLDFKYLEEDTFELNVLAENFCKEQDMKLVSKKLVLTKDKNAFLTFTASYGKNEFYGKIVTAQPYYYMMLTNAKDKNSEKFFNSLSLSNPTYTQEFEKYTDSTLYFNVNTLKLANNEKKFLMPYEAPKPKPNKKEPEAKNYYFSRTHYFQAVESNECVMVEANWFPKYSNAESVDTFWVRRARKYGNGNDLF
ncbi:MAG: TraB/GumN family protein [Bacteroidetes bacterium]|nr:TraB/GumN family protein [Bacteroidota bacterium]